MSRPVFWGRDREGEWWPTHAIYTLSDTRRLCTFQATALPVCKLTTFFAIFDFFPVLSGKFNINSVRCVFSTFAPTLAHLLHFRLSQVSKVVGPVQPAASSWISIE
jgi:hypothetical protein